MMEEEDKNVILSS